MARCEFEGWKISALSDVAKIKGGKRVPKGESLVFENTGFPYIRVADFTDEGTINLDNLRYIEQDVFEKIKNYTIGSTDLYISIAGTIGKAGIVPDELSGANLTENACKLVFNQEVFNKYAYYYTQSKYFLEQAGLNTRVAAMPKLALSRLGTIHIPYPPIPEQKRIVAILDKAFAEIDRARALSEQNLKNARELFESYLQQVFDQKNEGWEYKNLDGVLIDRPRNGWSPPAKNHSDFGVPVLSLSSVTGFNFNLEKTKFTTAKTNVDSHYWVENGDLLITRSNTPELVGHVAICSGIKSPTIYPDLMMKLKVNNELVVTRFLYYLLRSKNIRDIIIESAQGANPTMKKINQGIVQGLPIRYPTLKLQNIIIDNIDSVYFTSQTLEKKYKNKLLLLEQLKKSILQKAFSGELTANKS